MCYCIFLTNRLLSCSRQAGQFQSPLVLPSLLWIEFGFKNTGIQQTLMFCVLRQQHTPSVASLPDVRPPVLDQRLRRESESGSGSSHRPAAPPHSSSTNSTSTTAASRCGPSPVGIKQNSLFFPYLAILLGLAAYEGSLSSQCVVPARHSCSVNGCCPAWPGGQPWHSDGRRQ